MKNKILLFILGIGLSFTSCVKEEEVIDLGTAPPPNTLTNGISTPSTVVLMQENGDDDFAVLSWTAADFGGKPVNYSIEMDLAENDFTSAKDIITIKVLEHTLTVADINTALILYGIEPGETVSVDIRIRSWVNYITAPGVSNEMQFTLTPYELIFPPIYLIGDAHNGWGLPDNGNPTAPSSALELESYSPGIYEATDVKFGPGKFRFLDIPNWSTNTQQWGFSDFTTLPPEFASGNDGDDNIAFVGTPGNYNVVVDLATNKITIELGTPAPPLSLFLVSAQLADIDDAIEIPSKSQGVYESVLLVAKNTKFRFFAAKSWTAEKFGWSYFDEALIDSDLGNSGDDVSNFVFLSDPSPEPNTYFKITVTLADKSIVVVPAPPPFPATLLINGDPQGWNFNNSPYLQNTGVGEYEGIAKLSNGSFRFFGVKDDWNSDYGYDKFTTIPGIFGDGGGGDRNFTYSGVTRYYKFHVSLINKTITISDASLLVVGEAGDGANWNFGAAPVLTWVSGGIFTVTATFNNGDDFRFFDYPNWSLPGNEYNFNYFTTVDAELNVSGGDANFNFNGTSGSHTLTVDLIAKTVDIN